MTMGECLPPERVIAELGQLDPIAYDRRRRDDAERLGVRVSTLDDEVQKYRVANGLSTRDDDDNMRLKLTQVEPWDEEVDGVALLNELVAAFHRYLALPDGAAEALALWTVHSHAHDAADVSPRIAVTSPEPGCGKTTCLTTLSKLCPRPLPASNISPAAVFRAVEAFLPTLLIDELDGVFKKGGNDELRNILNSGHHRDMAYVIRTVGDTHEPKQFSTWAPMATAAIGNIPPTLEARSIVVRMRRRRADEHVERLRPGRTGYLDTLARQCARWAADNADDLAGADPEIPEVLLNRAGDNWRPLIAVADRAGGDWPEKSRRIAVTLSGTTAGEDPSVRIQLLTDLRQLFTARATDRLPSSDICAALAEMEERPWPEWRNGKPITARQVAKLLGSHHIKPKSIRLDNGTTPKGYLLEWFDDAFVRYLPPQSATPPQVKAGAGLSPIPKRHNEADVADWNPPKANDSAGCGGVADKNGGVAEERPIEVEI